MDSTTNNNNQLLFLCELKELRNEISTMKKRIVQLEDSHEKQQERINILERENHSLRTKSELNNIDGNKAVASLMKRKRTDQDTKPTSASTDKKKAKITNNNEVIPRRDNGDSFDTLSDDLLHKIVEFDGYCYSKFGSINKRCRNIYDMEEYKLKKQTCLCGYGTVEMMLEHYLQKRREGEIRRKTRYCIARAVIWYNRLDAIEWVIQLGDSRFVKVLCGHAARYGRIDILSNVFCKCNLTLLEEILNDTDFCESAVFGGKLKALEWLRKYGAKWDAETFAIATEQGRDELIQYLRLEGCPEPTEDTGDESSESEQFDTDWEESDY